MNKTTTELTQLTTFERQMPIAGRNGGSDCAFMQDIADLGEQIPRTAASGRPVDARSFRSLTERLKRLPKIAAMVQTLPVASIVEAIAEVPEQPPAELRNPEPPVEVQVTLALPEVIAALVPPVIVVANLPEEDTSVLPRSGISHLQRKLQEVLSTNVDEAVAPTETFTLLTPEQETEKAELARALLDMMSASAVGGQPQERALAADTLLRMLPQLPTKIRIAIAERLAMMEVPPPFLVARLIASKDIAVAGPLLEDCMHISDEDLFALIQMANLEKLRLLARRRRISRPISDALAASEDASVLLTLVRNKGAELSNEGFALLAAAAQIHPDLLAPMCTRQDLPVHFAFQIFWNAPAQLRRYLLSRFLTESEMLTKILKITMDQHGGDLPTESEASLERIGQALEQIMDNNRTEGVISLSKASNVSVETIERILTDAQGEPLMALLKVVGVPRSELEKNIGQLAQGAKPLIDPSRNLDEVQAVFDQLSFNKARILLTYWDWASHNSGPYARAA